MYHIHRRCRCFTKHPFLEVAAIDLSIVEDSKAYVETSQAQALLVA
jgi:hypothetical protein